MTPAAPRGRTCAGWAALALVMAISCFWAFWGIKETFHEGWYYGTLLKNIALSLTQYLSPLSGFLFLGVFSIFYPRIGSAICFLIALLAFFFFRTPAGKIFIAAPALALCAAYWFGRINNKRLAVPLLLFPPIMVLLAFGVPDAIRVAGRVNDGNFGARVVEGNGVRLVWAPEGPGWPAKGADWHEAREICRHLSEDGLSLSPHKLDIWRLPTVDEAARSLVRGGRNAGGVWNMELKQASYKTPPDKETPLWNPLSSVIYLWTATESGADQAYYAAYNGVISTRKKSYYAGEGYQSFRAVKD